MLVSSQDFNFIASVGVCRWRRAFQLSSPAARGADFGLGFACSKTMRSCRHKGTYVRMGVYMCVLGVVGTIPNVGLRFRLFFSHGGGFGWIKATKCASGKWTWWRKLSLANLKPTGTGVETQDRMKAVALETRQPTNLSAERWARCTVLLRGFKDSAGVLNETVHGRGGALTWAETAGWKKDQKFNPSEPSARWKLRARQRF